MSPADSDVFAPTDAVSDANREKEKTRRELQIADLTDVLRLPAGQRLLARIIIDKGGILRQTFDMDARVDVLRQGERNLALWLLAELGAADDKALAILLTAAQQVTKGS